MKTPFITRFTARKYTTTCSSREGGWPWKKSKRKWNVANRIERKMFTCRANIWWKHVRQLPFRIRCVDRPAELCEGLIGNQNSLLIDWAGEIRNRIQDERERERALNSTITEAVENIRRNRIVVVLFRVSSQKLHTHSHATISPLSFLSHTPVRKVQQETETHHHRSGAYSSSSQTHPLHAICMQSFRILHNT